jgi:dTDP-4-dehydrorhamnose reductase
MNIIGTGLSGLVGSRIVELNPQHQFTDLSLDSGFNILQPDTFDNVFSENPANVVLHLAAFTDTNAAFLDNGNKSGLCYQINVVGTENIAKLCQKYNKHLIFISTDFVFDGTKQGPYTESDIPKPIDWYGQTKLIGEQLADTVVRIAYPYRAKFDSKIDIVRKIKAKLENHEEVKMFSDQITTPTFIDDIAKGLGILIDKKPTGIYHLVGSSSQSPYDMAKLIATTFGLDETSVKATSLAEYLSNPTARPYSVNGAISNQKFVNEFGFTPQTLSEGLSSLLLSQQS